MDYYIDGATGGTALDLVTGGAGFIGSDPPPMKWSDSKYGIAIEEDYHGEETQAGRGGCEVATG